MFTLRARAGAEGGAVSPRSDVGWSSAWRGRARRRPCRHRVAREGKKSLVVAFKKTKHILRAAEFLRDLVSRGVISVEHLPGVVMIADLLTKAVSRAIFTGLIKQLDDFHAL